MPGSITSSGPDDGPPLYSPLTGLIYIFNLIVGTGALTLPAAFRGAGWALSSALIVMLSFMSYLTATFMIEAMAAANAMRHWRRVKHFKRRHRGMSDEMVRSSLLNTEEEDDDSRGEEDAVDQQQAGQGMYSALPSASTHNGVDTSSGSSAASSPVQNASSTYQFVNRVEDKNAAEGSEVNLERAPLIAAQEQLEVEVRRGGSGRSSSTSSSRSSRNMSAYYDITEVIEMGKMAGMFFSKTGRTLFYICLIIYLYGDLAIYGAAVAKSIRDVACNYRPPNATSQFNISEGARCWEDEEVTRLNAYRIFLTLFIGIVGPFAFCNITKTKYLQIFTSLMRWLAFGSMVALAISRLSKNMRGYPPVADFGGVPNLFGVCVYSFMCHHSLPSLVTPINRKRHLSKLLFSDYVLILSFYLLLAFTGIFAFEEINDLYTLNFQPKPGEPWYLATIHYFLSLFPVFTLSTNFPIIAITLRNNLKTLFLTEGRMYSWFTRHCLFPLLALLPPVAVAMVTNSLEFLVGITGSYAGAGIQYVFPALLVYYGRKTTVSAIGVGVRNQHSSTFKSSFWVLFVNLWALGCVIIVTWNHIAGAIKS